MLKQFARMILALMGLFCLVMVALHTGANDNPNPVLTFATIVDNRRDILMVDINTGHIVNISNTPNADEWRYQWADDGRLLYTSTHQVASGDALRVMNASLSDSIVLPTGGSNLFFQPEWSSDNRYVSYFSSYPRNVSDIFVVDVDSLLLTNLTNTATISEQNPSWSPDGRYLSYILDDDIYLLELATNQIEPLTRTPQIESDALWSPDGQWMAFFRAGANRIDPHIVHVSLRGERRIPVERPAKPYLTWSPDSTQVALILADDNLYTYHINTGEITQRTTDAAFASNPSWSHDGRIIAYLERGTVRLLNIETGDIRTLNHDARIYEPLIWKPET